MRWAVLAAAALLAAPAAAQPIGDSTMLSAADPATMARYLQQLGYRANLTKDREGDPKIETGMAGRNVSIFFYNCTNGARCEDIQFYVGIGTRTKLGLADVNRFNLERRFARLYLDDEQDPILELDVSMLSPGISAAAFRDTVQVFERQVGALDALIDKVRAGR
jgi:hypothetical protein